MTLPGLLTQGLGPGLPEPVMRFVLASSLALGVGVSLTVGVLVHLREAPDAAMITPDVMRLPGGWLFPRMKQIPMAEVATCTVTRILLVRKLVVETTAGKVFACSDWYFRSAGAVDVMRRRVESEWLATCDDEDRRARFLRTAELGCVAAASVRFVWVAIVWWSLVYVAQTQAGNLRDTLFLTSIGADVSWLVASGELHRAVSSAALHGAWLHLLANALACWLIYPPVSAVHGWARCSIVFMAGVLAASAAMAVTSSKIGVGASGGLFGLLGALLLCGFTHRGRVGSPFVPPRWAVVIVVGLELASQIFLPKMATTGHLAGLLAGAITAWLIGGRTAFVSIDQPERRICPLAGAACIALLVLIPAVALVRGVSTDVQDVAIHSLDAMRERDLAAGAGIHPGFVICLAPNVERRAVARAYEIASSVPVEGDLRAQRQVMLGCLAFRLGEPRRAWQIAHEAAWEWPSSLTTLVLTLAGREAVARGLPAFVEDGLPMPSLVPLQGGLEIRFEAPLAESLDVDLLIEQAGVVGMLSTRVDRLERARVATDADRGCEGWELDSAKISLIAVHRWPEGLPSTEPATSCANLAEEDGVIRALPN